MLLASRANILGPLVNDPTSLLPPVWAYLGYCAVYASHAYVYVHLTGLQSECLCSADKSTLSIGRRSHWGHFVS